MENAKIGVSELRNPQTTATKFGTGHYVGDMTPPAKIQSNRRCVGVPANW